MMKRQSGFTLVEIAIVLVIIGLLLGGILKGQEMITQAKIKNVVNDFNGITAAMNSYQDRYRALPGDDINAATRWTNPLAISGDGNGQLCSVATCASPPVAPNLYNNIVATTVGAPEVNLFWWHLRLAGFVGGSTLAGAGSSTSQPNNAANGMMGVQTGGPAGFFTSNMICSSNLPDKIAIAVDTQMDDGSAAGGQVRANLQASPNPALHAIVAGDAYVESGTAQYILCANL